MHMACQQLCCVLVVLRRPVLQCRSCCWTKHREPTNLIPVRLIPTCLQRGSDYQKGEALVADTARLSASQPVPGQSTSEHTAESRKMLLCASLPMRTWVSRNANDWGSWEPWERTSLVWKKIFYLDIFCICASVLWNWRLKNGPFLGGGVLKIARSIHILQLFDFSLFSQSDFTLNTSNVSHA